MYYPAVRLQLHVEYFEQVALCGGAELLEQPVPFGERMVVTDECVEVFPVVLRNERVEPFAPFVSGVADEKDVGPEDR